MTAPVAVHPATRTGEDHRKVLMWVFLASDTLYFGSIIATFVVYASRGLHIVDGQRVPLAEVFRLNTVLFMAFLLLMGSVMMALAVWAAHEGRIGLVRVYLLATALLSSAFLGFQGVEFSEFVHEGFTPRVSPVGSAFFALTGSHGAHVTVSTLWLLGLLGASFRGGITRKNAIWVEVAGLFYHFVDVAWIVILSVVYLIGATLW